jgi:hypothetical protein
MSAGGFVDRFAEQPACLVVSGVLRTDQLALLLVRLIPIPFVRGRSFAVPGCALSRLAGARCTAPCRSQLAGQPPRYMSSLLS